MSDVLERVRARNASLARQGDPLGLMAGSYEQEPETGPTRARSKNAKFGIDPPEVSTKVDRRAHAVRDIFADLRRRQQITDDQLKAGQKFSRTYELAYRGRSVTPSYGTRFAEGTPLSQLSANAIEEDGARIVDYVHLHMSACAALPGRLAEAMGLACDGRTPGEIGRTLSTYSGVQSAAAGVTLVATALDILVVHYGMRHVPQ